MTIDWSKAPEGVEWYMDGLFFKPVTVNGCAGFAHWICGVGSGWFFNEVVSLDHLEAHGTPRPAEPKPYTRDEALQFLVERLDSWPTDIADAPLCPGWGWGVTAGDNTVFSNIKCGEIDGCNSVSVRDWQSTRPDFAPFVSVEDAQPVPDMVNHPPHYQSDNGVECIDAIRAALGHDGFLSYCTGNAIKYLWRDKTDRVEDLRKAAWYLNRAIQEEQHRAQTDR